MSAPGTISAPSPAVRRKATLALLSVCIFWGATFTWMKQGTGALQEVFGHDTPVAVGSFFLLVRFVLAALLMPIVLPRSVRKLDTAAWRWGFWVSLPFAAGFMLQIFGLTQPDVPPSQSAFLTSLYVVATPLLSALLLRRVPSRGVLLGVLLAAVGAAFIKGPPEGGLSIGAWATIACALVFGGHILITDTATRRADPLAITFTMFVFSTLWLGATLALAPGGPAMLQPAPLAEAFSSTWFLVSEALCAVLASVIALSVLNRWQKELSPTRAAIVYTAEPVFAAIISVASGEDAVTGWLMFGAGMILLANLAAELVGRRPQPS
ncbi:MAG: EamA family transporter [Planctomycetes bacterium]|nr:EamA family transporter [Planctomycetota bacterium]